MADNILSNIKLIIFDLDGVIFDIIDAIRDSVSEAITKYQLKSNLQDVMQDASRVMEIAQTMPIPQLILNAKELLDVPILKDMTVLRRLRIAAHIYTKYRTLKEQCRIFEGIDIIIKGLVKKGIKLAILSNNKRSYIIDALKKENLEGYFKLIMGFNDVSKVKPDPEGILKIMESEHISPSQTLFIGDMISDIQAGKNANIKTIAVASGLCEKSKLEMENPYKLVANIPELKMIFGV